MNRYLIPATVAASLLLGVINTSQAAGSAAISSIEQYTWHKRLLVVFADDVSSAAFAKQRASVQDASDGYTQRDLQVIEVIGNDVQGASDSADALRRRYGVKPGAFRAVLVGKDGGVKLESREPIASRELFTTIDGMPMRKQEAAGNAPKS
ncbi:DUF4174 domain-containing protein [Caballeronia sp. GACF4]|uniref:DUF4174 domain-containing protein n=1 Tax=Caballeronia sp. GACF4 TaxID=2921763 RepID=UPI002028377A|nr:DUF4174 domain-containing protein [Caballeronia sp. GACF4]